MTAFAATFTAMLLGATGAQADTETEVRFVHAVPGVGEATLEVDGGQSAADPQAAFGEASDPEGVPSGPVQLSLRVGGEGPAAATATETMAEGASYTVVASGTADDIRLEAYREGSPEEGVARVRMIHAAPELGEADLSVGGQEVANGLGYGLASDYREVTPGSYDVAVTPAGPSTQAIVRDRNFPLTAGTTSSAIVVGSAGERVRIVPVADASAAASGAPQTGLGGLEEEGTALRWLIVLAGALGAGALGAVAHRKVTGRRDAARGG